MKKYKSYKKICLASILAMCMSFPIIISVMGANNGSTWTDYGKYIQYTYQGSAYHKLEMLNGGDTDNSFDFQSGTWTYTEDPSDESDSVYFRVHQYDKWLNTQYAVIKVKKPSSTDWTKIAEDPYGSDPADCYTTRTKSYLIGKSEGVTGKPGWYKVEVFFQGKFTLIGTATYTSQFYLVFKG